MYRFEDFKFKNMEPISIKRIEEIENNLNIKLPDIYKAFLIKYNSAWFEDYLCFSYKKDRGYLGSDKNQYTDKIIGTNQFLGLEEIFSDIKCSYYSNIHLDHKKFIPIMRDQGGNLFMLCVDIGKNHGKIYYADESSECTYDDMYYLAENFDEFFDSLIDEETYEKISSEI